MPAGPGWGLQPEISPRPLSQCLLSLAARTEDGKEELRFLSGCNPWQLERLSAPL